MRIIEFNGLGKPMQPDICTGKVLILLQQEHCEIVKLEILPPEEFGPCLHPAKNTEELKGQALALIRKIHPNCIESERHWIFECPDDISIKAVF